MTNGGGLIFYSHISISVSSSLKIPMHISVSLSDERLLEVDPDFLLTFP